MLVNECCGEYACMLMSIVVPRVAVIREEGSNGDREMAAALLMAGFEVWDINMQDLKTGASSLDAFRGVVFVGGFSYADVLGSAKGLLFCSSSISSSRSNSSSCC